MYDCFNSGEICGNIADQCVGIGYLSQITVVQVLYIVI